MSNEEKLKAILERIQAPMDFGQDQVSAMVIIGYLDEMEKVGMVKSAFSISSLGKTVISICEEFDWKPTDIEIAGFVHDQVDLPDRVPFMYLIKNYRDDREKLLDSFDKFNNGNN